VEDGSGVGQGEDASCRLAAGGAVYPGQRRSGRRLANWAFGGIPQGSWLLEARHGHGVGCAREASVLAPEAMTTVTATGLRQAVWKNGPGREVVMRASGRGWWKRQWGQAPRVVLATTGVVRGRRRRQGVQRIPACHYQKSSVHLSTPCCYSSGYACRCRRRRVNNNATRRQTWTCCATARRLLHYRRSSRPPPLFHSGHPFNHHPRKHTVTCRSLIDLHL
jgi:hypothetical protein